jgi:WD40 repeat protein
LNIADPIRSLSFSMDGQWLAVGCKNGAAGYWNLRDQVFTSLEVLSKRANAHVLFSTKNDTLVHYCFGGRTLCWYDPMNGKISGEMEFSEAIHGCCYSPEGLLLVEQADSVEVWNLETKAQQDRIHLNPEIQKDVAEQMCFSPDGSTLAISFGQTIQCWNWKTRQMIMDTPVNGGWKDWRKSDWENRWIAFANPSTLLRYRINRDSLTVLGARGHFQMPIQSTAIRE